MPLCLSIKKKKIFSLLSFILLLLGIFPKNSSALKTNYSLNRSVRSLGMGGAFHSLSDDEYVLFFNPAGSLSSPTGNQLHLINVQSHFSENLFTLTNFLLNSTQSTQRVSDIADQFSGLHGNPIHIGLSVFPVFKSSSFTFGILVADLKSDIGILSRDLDSYLDLSFLSDSGIFINKSFFFSSAKIGFGVTAKGIYRLGGHKEYSILDLAQDQTTFQFGGADFQNRGIGIDFDLGLQKELLSNSSWNMGMGIVLHNILASAFPVNRVGEVLPLSRVLSLGMHLTSLGKGIWRSITIRMDYDGIELGNESQNSSWNIAATTPWKNLQFGAECVLLPWVAIRTGLHQGNWTAGFGIATPLFRLDFATYGEELFSFPGRLTQRRYAIRVALGIESTPYFSRERAKK